MRSRRRWRCRVAHRRAAEDAVEEVVLVLPRRLAGAERRVGPVELVREADVHVLAVLPVVLVDRAVRVADRGVVGLPELLALDAHVADAHAAVGGREAAVRARVRVLVRVVEGRGLVVLALAAVLGADVPVHVDGAHAHVVVVRDGREGGVAGVGPVEPYVRRRALQYFQSSVADCAPAFSHSMSPRSARSGAWPVESMHGFSP